MSRCLAMSYGWGAPEEWPPGLSHSSFDAAAYAAFRDLPLATAAGAWAAMGAVGPLSILARWG
jgi:hypothetical protein